MPAALPGELLAESIALTHAGTSWRRADRTKARPPALALVAGLTSLDRFGLPVLLIGFGLSALFAPFAFRPQREIVRA